MQHAHHAHLPTHKTRVTSQVLHRRRRGAEEQVIDLFLVAPSHAPEFAGQGDRQQKVGHRQKQVLLLLQPLLSLVVLALGTVAVATRMMLVC